MQSARPISVHFFLPFGVKILYKELCPFAPETKPGRIYIHCNVYMYIYVYVLALSLVRTFMVLFKRFYFLLLLLNLQNYVYMNSKLKQVYLFLATYIHRLILFLFIYFFPLAQLIKKNIYFFLFNMKGYYAPTSKIDQFWLLLYRVSNMYC